MEESRALALVLERKERVVGEGSGRVTHRHVRPCSNEGVGHGVDELATHAEVAQFDLTARVHQDVGGLNVYRDQKETMLDAGMRTLGGGREGQGPNPSSTTCLFFLKPHSTALFLHAQQKHFTRCCAYCELAPTTHPERRGQARKRLHFPSPSI